MKTLLHLGLLCAVFTLFTFSTSFAQIRLDVEGDAKIRGKMDISNGSNSVLIGIGAGDSLTTGNNNTFIGANAGKDNTSGFANTFIGEASGRTNTTGQLNTFVGKGAGFSNLTGFRNTYLGYQAGQANTIGRNNSYFGYAAGGTITNSINSTFLGAFSGQTTPTDSLNRAIAIGENAKVNCSNCAVIGGSGADAVNVGIGTDTPETKLHVTGSVRFDQLPDVTGANLMIDDDGNLGIAPATQNLGNRIDQLEAENEELRMRLDQLEQLFQDLSSQTETRTTQKAIITRATLQQNAPNPFTEATNINYFIPEGTRSASLQVLDQNGRIIKHIPIQARGEGQITLQANLLSAGTYSYSLVLDGRVVETKRMVLTH
ncbi:MAG: hypothetical protein AAGG68_29705 [Bacteroidota bacterium]